HCKKCALLQRLQFWQTDIAGHFHPVWPTGGPKHTHIHTLAEIYLYLHTDHTHTKKTNTHTYTQTQRYCVFGLGPIPLAAASKWRVLMPLQSYHFPLRNLPCQPYRT